jgi:hypothetical protein
VTSARTGQRSRPWHHVEPDALAERAAQQHGEVRQHVAELDHLRAQRLLAREGQQLAHQARRAVGVLLDLHDVVERRVRRLVVHQQQVGMADDAPAARC